MDKQEINLNDFQGIDVPKELQACPYCGGALSIQSIGGWSIDDSGGVCDLEITLGCANEPDMEEDEAAWDDWDDEHSIMPYVFWLPAEEKVKQWMVDHYGFYLAPSATEEQKKLQRWIEACKP